MKLRTRLFSLLLAGAAVFSLASCSGNPVEDLLPQSSASAEPSASPSDAAESASDSLLPDGFTADPDVEDLCLATTGIPGSFELATVNGAPITAYSYLYWLASNVLTSYGTSPDSDPTLADLWKEESLDAAVQYSLVASKAHELGYELTQEQIGELEDSLELTAASLGGQEALADALRRLGTDYDAFYNITAAAYYFALLRDGLYAGRPTSEEMDAYIEENDILSAKHILLMTVDPATGESLEEAAIAEKKATAEDLLAQLQASGDPLADFDTLMNQYSEDTGLISYPDGYTFTAGQMVSAFEDATRELEFGQISGLVESEYGYHIILRLDPDTEEARTDYRADLMFDQLEAWTDEAEIVLSDEYQALDIPLFYAKYMAYQDAFSAADTANASED